MEARQACTTNAETQARLRSLSRREHEVLELILAGKLTKQIAVMLGISPKMVEVYWYQLHKKLDVDVAG